MTNSTEPLTTTACPPWCTVEHDGGPEFHAGELLGQSGQVSAPGQVSARLWQDDRAGATPGVVVCGQLIAEAEAHELGMALVRAADVLRRARRANR